MEPYTNWRWSDALVEPLASRLSQGSWVRVEEARKGGWLVRGKRGDEDVRWFSLDETGHFEPLTVFGDKRLAQLPELLSEWLVEGTAVELLAHRIGSRAVFRVVDPHGQTKIIKVYRKDRQLHDRWQHLADAGGEWRTPQVLSWDGERRVLTTELCPGKSLHDRWRASGASIADGDVLAQLLEWLQRQPVPAGFPVHAPDDEIRILRERLPVFERMLAAPPVHARETTERVLAALAREPRDVTHTSHRDLHDKQVLLAHEVRSLIDLDLCAGAPPALDCGNIVAHVRLRALQGLDVPWQEIASRVTTPHLSRYGTDSLPTWIAATLTRLALIYCRRTRAPHVIDELLASAGAALDRSREWRDLL